MSTLQLALVPLVGHAGDSTSGILMSTNNRKSSSSSSCAENKRSGTKRPRKYRPYISLLNAPMDACQVSKSGSSEIAVEFGRREILTSLYAACGCLDSKNKEATESSNKSGPESHKNKKEKRKKKERKRPMNGTKLSICAHCREAESWSLRYLSRKLIRLVLVHENPSLSDDATLAIDPSTATGSDNYNCTYRVQIRGENAPHCVSIDGIKCAVVPQGNNNDPTMQEQHEKYDEGWTTQPQVVTMGSVISFHHPGEKNDTDNQDERYGKSMHFQLCLIRDAIETESLSNGCVEVVQRGSCSQKNTTGSTHSPVGAGSSQSLASSCDCDGNEKPLTQRSDLSERKTGQNGSCSESQHYAVMATGTVPRPTSTGATSSSQAQTVPNNVAFGLTASVGGGDDKNGKESQISALDDPPSAPVGERNGVEAGSSGVAVATSSVASEEAGSTAHPSQSTVEVPSSIPQDQGSTSPALLPPRRSPRRYASRRQTSASDISSPVPGRSPEPTADIQSSCLPPHQMQVVEGQEHQQGPDSVSLEPASQRSQALNDDTNTPRPATQRNIIDLMTPESSSAATGLNSISRSRIEGRGHGAQEKLKKLEQLSGHSAGSGNHKMHPSPIDLTTSPALKSPGQCVIFFLQLGRGMSRARVELLSKTILAKKPDTCIVNAFNSSPPPSHVVIDPQIDAMNVASALEFDSPEKMASHFAASKIHAVTPHWVLACDNHDGEPPIDYLWGGYRRHQSASAAKPKINNSKKRRLQPKDRWLKSRKLDEFAPITSVKASELRDDDSSIGRLIRRREGLQEESGNRGIVSAMRGVAPKRNGALAAMFDEMADLQKQSPLEKIDEWRAYTYTMVAGRLRHLDFEVTSNADVLGSVRGIRGFGSGVMTKIRQFLATGSCDKLKTLRTDPARVAVRELTNIWGVGPKTASNLVNRGYRCIADVRSGLASGDIDLSDNARVCVDCYEDFLERMEREEVKRIGDIVAAAVYKVYPEAEVSTMGSYRRGKPQSGDADILVVHPGFVSTTPKNSLARVLKLLERDGHIANHLTTVKTSSDGILSNDSQLSANLDSQNDQDQLSVDDEYRAATTRRSLTLGDDHPGSVSWMGVFYSPMHDGKRRRVDIKFYPYREKAFCKLYFTGSGTFNRSMRLWATKSCKMTLNDHGLFRLNVSNHHQYYRMKRDDKRQSRGERINCKTEKDIFDALGLKFRTPQERGDFDDVIEKGSAKPISLDVSEKDFAEESRQQWVQ